MSANADFMWRVCFDLYVRWSDFLQAKFLAHVIKFESWFTLFIRIKGFFTFTDKLILIFCSEIVQYVWYVIWLQLHHFKVRFGEHFGNAYFTDKKVRVDNNENNSKMLIMLRSISQFLKLHYKLLNNFTFLTLRMRLVILMFFVRGVRRS